MPTFFSDYFNVPKRTLRAYGAFDVSLINDLPLFIDPFLLFHSKKRIYKALHNEIIKYLVFLRDKAQSGHATASQLDLWYCFHEVKQNWFGFSLAGNGGSGLGQSFAKSLHSNLHKIMPNFGDEEITEGTHLEKVCLVADGVGKDNISDFTTNLIKGFLCEYTQKFAIKHIGPSRLKEVTIRGAHFNFKTEAWETATYMLPWVNGDFVILTPRDILTRDENWINKGELIDNFESIPTSMPDGALREQISNYFKSVLARPKDREPNKAERRDAARMTIGHFPSIIDYYIRKKELDGKRAEAVSSEKVSETEQRFVQQVMELQQALSALSDFYKISSSSHEESHKRIAYFKDVIENKGGHKAFHYKGKAIGTEEDLQRMFRLVWYGTPAVLSTEVNDGRGPVDFMVSKGVRDKTLIEMKLARNTQLKRNLEKQLPIYQKASDAKHGIKVIIFFTREEEQLATKALAGLGLTNQPDIVLIDARADNKPSGSKA